LTNVARLICSGFTHASLRASDTLRDILPNQRRDAELNGWPPELALGFVALGPQEGHGHVNAFDLTFVAMEWGVRHGCGVPGCRWLGLPRFAGRSRRAPFAGVRQVEAKPA